MQAAHLEESELKLDHERLREILDAADAVRGINLDVLFTDTEDDELGKAPVDAVNLTPSKKSSVAFEKDTKDTKADSSAAVVQESVIDTSVEVIRQLLTTENVKKMQEVVLREAAVVEAEKLLLVREQAVEPVKHTL